MGLRRVWYSSNLQSYYYNAHITCSSARMLSSTTTWRPTITKSSKASKCWYMCLTWSVPSSIRISTIISHVSSLSWPIRQTPKSFAWYTRWIWSKRIAGTRYVYIHVQAMRDRAKSSSSKVFFDHKKELQVRSEPIQIEAFQTSIWDETLYAVSKKLEGREIISMEDSLCILGMGAYHSLFDTEHPSTGDESQQLLSNLLCRWSCALWTNHLPGNRQCCHSTSSGYTSIWKDKQYHQAIQPECQVRKTSKLMTKRRRDTHRHGHYFSLGSNHIPRPWWYEAAHLQPTLTRLLATRASWWLSRIPQ